MTVIAQLLVPHEYDLVGQKRLVEYLERGVVDRFQIDAFDDRTQPPRELRYLRGVLLLR